jgi:stage II sporulation protein D
MLPALRSLTLGIALMAPLAAELRVRAQPATEPQLRVLLQEAPALSVRAAGTAGLRLRDRQGRVLQELSANRVLQLQLGGGWVEAFSEAQPGGGKPVTVAGPELWIEPIASGGDEPILWLQQRRYRGQLQIRPQAERLQVVNVVPVETYLTSVVGSEMPASWPLEALRAQAVAARTYALKGRKPSAPFDLKATVASQVYKGVEAETESTRAAVAGTRGLVLTYGSTLIDAVFHSSSGGSTESSGDLWPQQLPYLVSVPDFDDEAPVREWRQPLDPSQLLKAFPETGGVSAVEVLATTPTGRVRQARVVGPAGQLLLSGAQLRGRLGLKSTWVRFEVQPLPAAAAAMAQGLAGAAGLAPPPLPAITPLVQPSPVQLVAVGRGFGHGIGMSQWGAYALARRGQGYAQILQHYYRGTQLRPYSDLAGESLALAPAGRP